MARDLVQSGDGVRLYREPDGFAVVRRWLGPRHVVALALGMALAATAVATFINPASHQAPWSVLAGMAVGVFSYACTGLNRTVVRIAGDGLEVRRGPLPVLGARARRFPMPRSVTVRFDRVVTIRGGVGQTHVVERTLPDARCIVLDLVPGREEAESMARLLRQAIESFP